MFKTLGRLLVRKGKTAGLFIPFGGGLKSGIYELRSSPLDPDGISLVWVGEPVLKDAAYQGLSVEGLVGCPEAGMTKTEWAQVCERRT